MRLTVWVFVDPSTGEQCATVRRPSPARQDRLNDAGCLVYQVEADLPDDLGVGATVRTSHVRKTQ